MHTRSNRPMSSEYVQSGLRCQALNFNMKTGEPTARTREAIDMCLRVHTRTQRASACVSADPSAHC